MNEKIVERLPAFEKRTPRNEPITWPQFLEESGAPDPFPWIEPLGFTSPRRAAEPRKEKIGRRCERLRWFSHEKKYGFTVSGVFVHASNVISGEPRRGARIEFDVMETKRGLKAVNVKVIR